MIRIGFVDYYLDEWHANNYPDMIKAASGGKMQVAYAYAPIEPPHGGVSNARWAEQHGVVLLDSIEEVVKKSDCLVVLSPDNPEMHEELCRIPLSSGKRTYVDKTFAPDADAARRIFAVAESRNTPCWSSSALRFADELKTVTAAETEHIISEGPSNISIYSIHQIEMIVALMNAPADSVMYTGDIAHPAYIIRFSDGRTAQCFHRNDPKWSFALTLADRENTARRVEIRSDYFGNFIKALVGFFDTGAVPVEHDRTVDVIGIRSAIIRASERPYQWIKI